MTGGLPGGLPGAAPVHAGPPCLALDAVGFRWPCGAHALAGVTLALPRGGALAVLGRSGAGKTTLLRLAAGQLAPSEGTVSLEGTPLDAARRRAIHREVGFVFQDPDDGLVGPTVLEDVALGPRNLGLPRDAALARGREALAAVDALRLAGRPVHELSFGEKKRVAIAGALALSPRLLVLDEPTAGLDPLAAEALAATLAELRRATGLTVLVGTHDVDLVPALADAVLVLDAGRVAALGPARKVLGRPARLAAAGLRAPLVALLASRVAPEVEPSPVDLESAARALGEQHR